MNYKEKYYRWLANTNVDQSTKKELESLPEKEIEERFYCDLEFGTGDCAVLWRRVLTE